MAVDVSQPNQRGAFLIGELERATQDSAVGSSSTM
jgi:hypothetical protein